MTTDSSAHHPHYLHNEHALAAMLELGQIELKELADEGEPYALLALGSKYLIGVDVQKDLSKGVECYVKAAEQGLPFAQILVGQHYRDGEGVESSRSEAKKWFQKAALQHAPPAMHELALYHMEEGRLNDAVELLHEAAELGFSSSQFQLGNLYEYDKTIGKNYAEAFKWISLAASENDDAKFHLAQMLRNGIGCDTDPVAALIICEELADQGHLDGTFVCGTMHWLGDGTVRDVERGARYIEWAAQQNLIEASKWKVAYVDWADMINWLHLLSHVDFDDLTAICPQCGELAEISAVDLHVFYSDLGKDLVLRTFYPDMDSIPLAYKVFLWDIEDGYQADVTDALDEESFAVDALARRLALLLDSGNEEAVKNAIVGFAEDQDQLTTLLNVAVIHGCTDPFPWLGKFICQVCIDKYPTSSESYTAMAACHLNVAKGEVDDKLAEIIEKLLLNAIALDPENETAKNFLQDLRDAT
ncbi:MAG: sel1 repeat family protein [Candidatus Melainabacteria bacterium]|nr:sel1 repeat family protein [Candidatus Melainabacteria bacterium]